MTFSITSIPKLSTDHCFYCHKAINQGSRIDCSHCNVVSCCSHQHQTLSCSQHQNFCLEIQRARAKDEEEQRKLKRQCWRCFIVDDPQQEHDHFWEWRDVRSAVMARNQLISVLSQIRSERAIRDALRLCFAVLEINHSDNLGVKRMIPGFLILLGLDQKAFTYIQRFRRLSSTCQYAWAHMDMPVTDSIDPGLSRGKADSITEALASGEYLDISIPLAFRADFALLALRLLLCLKSLENTSLLHSKVPPEIVGLVREHVATHTIKNDHFLWKEVRTGESLRSRILSVQKHLEGLFASIRDSHPHFGDGLRGCKRLECGMLVEPDVITTGKLEMEAVRTYRQSYDSWAGTPGALEWVRDKLAV